MNRRAILIDAGGTPGEKGYLPGPAADVRSLRLFLLSNPGGAWDDKEIVVLRNPSKVDVQRELVQARSSDYCFVSASGHGRHVQGRGIDETRFCCNQNEEIAAHQLNCGSQRSTVFLDCCRHVTRTEDISIFESRAKSIKKYAADRSAYLYRATFDAALGAAETGCCYLYSCDLHQAAQETQNGGYFTQACVDAAVEWHENYQQGKPRILDLWDVHSLASQIVKRREPQQDPKYQLGRRLRHFPFAVFPESVHQGLVLK